MRRLPSVSRFIAALASVRLAVVTMAAVGIACVAATFYEARHGTAAAQRMFYGSAWFTALLGLLGANVLFSMTKRYPWNRHHTGFVLAHLGILLLLAGSLVSLHAGLDGQVALLEGETTDRVGLAEEALRIELPGQARVSIPVAMSRREGEPARPERITLPGGAALLIEGFRPHVTVGSSWIEGVRRNPALHFTLAGEGVQEQAWLRAADPTESHVDFGPVVLGFHEATTPKELVRMRTRLHEGNHLCLILAPDGQLFYSLSSRKGSTSGSMEVGRPIPTPWMQLALTVDRFLENAEAVRIVTRAPVPEADGARQPALQARFEGTDARAEWVVWDEPLELASPSGRALVSYGPREAGLPFRVTLLEFRSDKYPGSNRAATFQSRVRLDDPERGLSEHLISMNHPLHHRGYTFFQASFVEGERMTSIFSVARSPGLPLVYLGTLLLTVGIVWMFYVKPLLARRQGRRALESRGAGFSLAGGEAI